jgi:hypothetical protein
VQEWLAPLASRRLPNLAHLDLTSTVLDDDALSLLAGADWPAALARGPLAGHLEELHLNDHRFGDAGEAVLVTGQFPRLVSLGLGGTETGLDGLRALVELHLSGCRFGDAGAAVLAGARLPALRSLLLHTCGIGEEGARALAESAGLPAELTLDLQANSYGGR